MSKTIDILSFGAIYLDINCLGFPNDKIAPEKETVGGEYALQLGGSAVISVAVASNLGLKTAFVGKVGEDLLAQQLQQKLADQNITPYLLRSNLHQTNISINYINSAGRSVMTTVGNANQSLHAEELLNAIVPLLPYIKYLYLGGVFKFSHLIDFYKIIVKKAKDNDCKILLDHGRVTNVVTPDQLQLARDLAPMVDVYIPSIEEARVVWQASSGEEALEIIHQHAEQLAAIITDGPRGAMGIDQTGNIFRSKATNIKPLNTVGAGDTFNAGFMYAMLQGMECAQAMQLAQVTAEYKIETNRYPTAEKVAALLETK